MKTAKNLDELKKMLLADLPAMRDKLVGQMGEVVADTAQPRTQFPLAVEKEEGKAIVHPVVNNEDERDEFLEEETKGSRPFANALFFSGHKKFMVNQLRQRRIKGVK